MNYDDDAITLKIYQEKREEGAQKGRKELAAFFFRAMEIFESEGGGGLVEQSESLAGLGFNSPGTCYCYSSRHISVACERVRERGRG